MINTRFATVFAAIVLFFSMSGYVCFQQEPWKADQLMAPADLAALIKQNNAPLIISIGPAAPIKGSIDIGPANDRENLQKLKALLAKQDQNREVVIYCGCCPFEHCPNIRPAFTVLNEMKFTHQKLLNLPHNVRVDWMSQGYPVQAIVKQ